MTLYQFDMLAVACKNSMTNHVIRLLFIVLLSGLTASGYCQSSGDSKILVTLQDTTGLYDKVRLALIKNDFIVKDDRIKDTLTTYPAELKTMAGHAVLRAVVTGFVVELTGIYSLKKLNSFGYTKPGKDSQRIVYYRGSKTWKILEKVAETIGGQLSFAK